MKTVATKDIRGWIVLSVPELQRWNLRFLMYQDRKIVNFCNTDFYCKKLVFYDITFIVLAIVQSSCDSIDEIKNLIRSRAPNIEMTDADFFRVHKSYRAELNRIKKQSYYVGQPPEDFMPPEKREELELLKAKLAKGKRFQKHHPKAKKTLKKHFGDLGELEALIIRMERIYNQPEEKDFWTDHKTTIDDYDW